MEELFASLRKDFVEETGPLAREVAGLVLRLEEAHAGGEDHADLRHAMKSALHTIKGNAAMMGLGAIELLAHALEDFCLLVGQHPEGQEPRQVQILVDGTDLLVGSIQGSLQGEPDPVPVAAFIERVAQAREVAGEAAVARAPLAGPVFGPGECRRHRSERMIGLSIGFRAGAAHLRAPVLRGGY